MSLIKVALSHCCYRTCPWGQRSRLDVEKSLTLLLVLLERIVMKKQGHFGPA